MSPVQYSFMGHTRRYDVCEGDWYRVDNQERNIGWPCVYVANCPTYVSEILGWRPTVTRIFKIFNCSVIFCSQGKGVQFSLPQISDVLLPNGNYELQDGAVLLPLDDIIKHKSLFTLPFSCLVLFWLSMGLNLPIHCYFMPSFILIHRLTHLFQKTPYTVFALTTSTSNGSGGGGSSSSSIVVVVVVV